MFCCRSNGLTAIFFFKLQLKKNSQSPDGCLPQEVSAGTLLVHDAATICVRSA